jgi:hypothetical protein
MLSRTFRQSLIKSRIVAIRGGHGHGPAPLAPNGLAEVMKHDTGLDHHHHDHVHSAPLDHKFIVAGVNKKTMIFDGLHGKDNLVVEVDNQFHHLNGLSMFQ